jgi:hypothetical protein
VDWPTEQPIPWRNDKVSSDWRLATKIQSLTIRQGLKKCQGIDLRLTLKDIQIQLIMATNTFQSCWGERRNEIVKFRNFREEDRVDTYNVVADDDPETEDGHEEDHQRHAEHPREEKSAKAFAYSLDEQKGESDEQQTEEDDERSG